MREAFGQIESVAVLELKPPEKRERIVCVDVNRPTIITKASGATMDRSVRLYLFCT
jgi:hypothetical protein